MPSPDAAVRALASGLHLRRLTGGLHAPMLHGQDSRRWSRRRTPLFHYIAVEAGTLAFRIGGGSAATCAPGSALLIPPGTIHDLGRSGLDGTISWADFAIDCWGAVPIGEFMDFPSRPPPTAVRAIGAHIAAMLAVRERQDIATRLSDLCRHRGGVLGEVLALGRWRSEAAARIDVLLRLAPVLGDLADRLAEPWPRERLARETGVALTRLNQVFQAATGRSPAGFVRRLRLDRAAEMLLTTSLPLEGIATSLGFVDAFHLSRAFKGEHGVAPSLYRRRFRTGD